MQKHHCQIYYILTQEFILQGKKNLKSGFKVKLDLTKSMFHLLKKANNHVKEIPAISFCYVDVNCRLRVKFHDAKQEDIFFSVFDKLRDIVDSKI